MHRIALACLALVLGLSSALSGAVSSGGAQLGSAEKDVVLGFYDVFNGGRLEELAGIVAPDVVDHNPLPGQAPGIEGLSQALALFRAGFPDGQIAVDDVIADGEKVVTRTTFRGTHQGNFLGVPATGKAAEFMAIDIWRVVDDRIVEVWHIEDLLTALAQVGGFPASEPASPPSAGSSAAPVIFATGLTNPRGMAWDAAGTPYIALAGSGGPTPGDPPVPPPLGPFMGGPTGAVAKIVEGCPVPVATGLPSSAVGENGPIGITDLAFLDGQLYALSTGATASGGNPGTDIAILRIESDGTTTQIADLSTWALANPPAMTPPEGLPNPGNPYAMVAGSDGFWVTDAVLGLIIHVDLDGKIRLVADVSEGHPVPTGIAPAPDGGVYVGYLTALPYLDGTAKVVHVTADGMVTDVWTGLTAVTSIAVGSDGTLYATELSTGNTAEPPFIVPGSGRVVRRTGPDHLEPIATGLDFPVNVDVGPDGALYVVLPALGADHGEGSILRIDLAAGATTAATPVASPGCAPIPATLAAAASPVATPNS